MEQIELKVSERKVLGKKVRFLRRRGITPVHLFGRGIKSLALQCDSAELQRVLAEAGRSRLINLKFDGQRRTRTVVVREVQRNTRTGALLHVDFYQVKMAEAVRVEVPVVLVGESPVLRQKGNLLVQELSSLSVECLPANIPAKIELDLGSLTEPDQAVRVKDIKLGEGVTILNDPELVLVRIESRPVERVEEAVAAEEEVTEGPEASPEAEESKEE